MLYSLEHYNKNTTSIKTRLLKGYDGKENEKKIQMKETNWRQKVLSLTGPINKLETKRMMKDTTEKCTDIFD